MKKLNIAALSLVAITAGYLVSTNYAKKPAHTESTERVHHYAFKKPASTKAAKELFSDSLLKIENRLKSTNLNAAALEEIHEQSYALEASIDALRLLSNYPEAKIDNADEAVQALHYASEDHKETLTREWFMKLTAAYAELTPTPQS